MENFDIMWVICGMLCALIAFSGPMFAAIIMDCFSCKQKNIIIILCILSIIEMFLFVKLLEFIGPEYGGSYSSFSLENKFHLCYIGSMVLQAIIGYFWARCNSTICPECGTWNDYTKLKNVNRHNYSQWRTHTYAIRNDRNEKIGTYEDEKLHHYREDLDWVSCNQCGKEFLVRNTKEVG